MKYGHTVPSPEEKAKTKMLVKKFNEKFIAEHGSLICKQLTGLDISTPEGNTSAREEGVFDTLCPVFIKTACKILDDKF